MRRRPETGAWVLGTTMLGAPNPAVRAATGMTLTAVHAPANTLSARLRPLAPLVVGGIVFGVAFAGGTYGLTSRNSLAIAVWWCVALAVGLSIWPLARIPRAALLTGSLLAALAIFTGLSMLWAESNEKAFNEFNRIVLYLGVYLVAVLAGTRANARRWSDGIAFGIVAVALVALGSRLFPELVPESDVAPFLPAEQTRLSYPLNYWNGLAFLLAIGSPLLLRAAVEGGNELRRALAVAPLPAFAATAYLTSSRGGAVAAVLAVAAFVALTARRWAAAGAALAAGVGSAVAVGALLARDELVNGPLESEAARAQGRSAALVILVACAGAALVYGLAARYLPRFVTPKAHVGWAVVGVAVGLAFLGLAVADPAQRFEDFKQTPAADTTTVGGHFTSASGNGRWQWWSAAVDQFRENPLAGDGAGSYESWWLQHGDIAGFVRDAHSLYLETLGELGIVGFLLVVGLVASGIAVGASRVRRADVSERPTVAGLLAAFLAFALAAGIDWMWELTAVSAVAFVVLGLLTGAATDVAQPGGAPPEREPRRRPSVMSGLAPVALVAMAPFVVGAQAIPLASTLKVRDSQAAVTERDGDRALSDALAAAKLQPWAASPHLQVALVHEERGELDEAHAAIRDALAQDASSWSLWLVASRIETKLGQIDQARRSLDRAVELNPRSPVFAARR